MNPKRKHSVSRMTGLAAALAFAALVVAPNGANAQLSGDQITHTAHLPGGPFVDTVTVGPGVEIEAGGGCNLCAILVPGESVDFDNDSATWVFTRGLQGAFELSGLDSVILRLIEEITIGGTLSASSAAHLSFNNLGGTSFARTSVDCNPVLTPPCTGGTIVVSIAFAAIPPEESDESVSALIDFVIAQDFPQGTENPLLDKLNDALKKIEQGKTNAAIDKMNQFIAVTRSKEGEGTISTAIADGMVAVAEDIIEAIQSI